MKKNRGKKFLDTIPLRYDPRIVYSRVLSPLNGTQDGGGITGETVTTRSHPKARQIY
jgi:hypothetical protein